MLTALVALPVLGVAQTQTWRQDIRQDQRVNRQEYREAVRQNDWARANDEARQIQANERRLNQSNYYLTPTTATAGTTATIIAPLPTARLEQPRKYLSYYPTYSQTFATIGCCMPLAGATGGGFCVVR